MKKNSIPLLGLLVCVAILHGCGGGGGASTAAAADPAPAAGDGGLSGAAADAPEATPTPAPGLQLSGKVIDGYIEGATVCVDLNADRLCSPGEPSAVTGVGGLYAIDVSAVDPLQVASSNLVVYVPDTAKDADDGGKTLAEAGKVATTMMAPINLTTPSQHFITPLTTLVAQKMLETGLTNAAATDWVRSHIGLGPTDQLNVDYKLNTDLYQSQIAAATEVFEGQAALTRRCVLKAATSASWNDLSGVQACSVAALSQNALILALMGFGRPLEEVPPVYVALADVLYENLRNYDRIVDELRQYFDPTNTQLGTDFPDGIAEFRDTAMSPACAADPNCATPGYFRVRTSKFVSGVLESNEVHAIQQRNFVPNPTVSSYWQLVGAQWVSVPSQRQIQLRADGDFAITGGEYGSTGVMMHASGFRLAGMGLNTAGLNRFGAHQKFPSGANGYLISYKTATPRYVLSGPPVTGPNQEPITGSLADAYPSSAAPTWVNALASRTGMWLTFAPLDGSGSGVVTFRNPDVPNQVMPQTGAYQVKLVDGQLIVKITEIPDEVLAGLATFNPSARSDYDRGVRPIFGITADGSMREGTYTPVSVISNASLQMNRVALNALLQALSLCQLDAAGANTACPQ